MTRWSEGCYFEDKDSEPSDESRLDHSTNGSVVLSSGGCPQCILVQTHHSAVDPSEETLGIFTQNR
jgi:hypothetical protein